MNYTEPAKRRAPYNTGKVKIGENYTPPVFHEAPTDDMADLQAALLGERRQLLFEVWMMRATVAVCIATIVLDMFVWRPN